MSEPSRVVAFDVESRASVGMGPLIEKGLQNKAA